MSIYVDFHILQTVPPSCVNRDDTGSPKTAVYGGAVRARVSSQAWKHAMRVMFKKLFTEEELGNRTKFVVDMTVKEMLKLDSTLDETECGKKASAALKDAGISIKSAKGEDDKADALFFMSAKQAAAIAALICEGCSDKKTLQKALKDNPSVDIALFGRMAASEPILNCDAASQVAHAISTHAVQNEYDYFTAVDDLRKNDNAGAGHLGTVEFNSSTLYRYATVNITELSEHLGKEAVPAAVKKFADAFICSMPTGKQNTFANRTFPDMVYVTVRNDQPVNLCGAFERPVKNSDEGYLSVSEKRLAEYAKTVYRNFASEPDVSFAIGDKDGIGKITDTMPLDKLLSELERNVFERLGEE